MLELENNNSEENITCTEEIKGQIEQIIAKTAGIFLHSKEQLVDESEKHIS